MKLVLIYIVIISEVLGHSNMYSIRNPHNLMRYDNINSLIGYNWPRDNIPSSNCQHRYNIMIQSSNQVTQEN